MSMEREVPLPAAESLREYGRGIAGGFLFSLPLLLTLEMWAAGASFSPARLLAGLLATLVLLCGYNAYAGLRFDSTFTEIVIDSVEELGLGLALSAILLALLAGASGLLTGREFVGAVITQGLMVAIGVSVGTAQISSEGAGQGSAGRHLTLASEVVLALCGTVLVAANVALLRAAGGRHRHFDPHGLRRHIPRIDHIDGKVVTLTRAARLRRRHLQPHRRLVRPHHLRDEPPRHAGD